MAPGYRLTTEAEAVDRVGIGLPGVQAALTKAVVAANPNTVLVMLNAGPLAIEWEAANVPAIVEAYFPGELPQPLTRTAPCASP